MIWIRGLLCVLCENIDFEKLLKSTWDLAEVNPAVDLKYGYLAEMKLIVDLRCANIVRMKLLGNFRPDGSISVNCSSDE